MFSVVLGINKDEATAYLMQMRNTKRIKEDIWT